MKIKQAYYQEDGKCVHEWIAVESRRKSDELSEEFEEMGTIKAI